MSANNETSHRGHTRVDIQPVNGHQQEGETPETKPGWDEETKEGKEDGDKKEKLPPVPFFQLFRYSSNCERVVMVVGVVAAVVAGMGTPCMFLLFGDITDAFVSQEMKSQLDKAVANSGEELDGFLKEIFDTLVKQSPQMGNLTKDELVEYLRKSHSGDGSDFFTEVTKFGVGTIGIGVGLLVLGYTFVAALNYAAEAQVYRLRGLFLQSILKQEIGWFDTQQTNDFASRVTEDLTKLQEGIGEKVGLYVFFMTIFLVSIIIAFIHSWQLTLIILTAFPVLAISAGILAKTQANLSTEVINKYAEAGSVAEEVLSAIRTVVAFGGEEKEVERYNTKLVYAKRTGMKRGMVEGLGLGVVWLVIYAAYALAFWYGMGLILEARKPDGVRSFDPSDLVVVFFCVLMGAMNVGQSAPYAEAMTTARAAAATIFSIVERRSAIDPTSTGGDKPDIIKGTIELRDVHFNYPSRPDVPVLRGASLQVQPGQTVALVGSSGCGKSTCVQLMQRFYDPDAGTVLLDGTDIRDLNLGWLREQIGVVGQEPVLFATTIAENIRYGREGVSTDDIQAAAKEANAHSFIMKLPKQYETQVGERGAQLSGGQKQRIAIARALVRQPRILLLDEATSALDNQSEALVQQALDKMRQGRSTVVVAHRLSTIQTADKIVAFDQGKIVEEGTHDELMAKGGLYHSLVNAQLATSLLDGEEHQKHEEINDIKELNGHVQEEDEDDTLSEMKKEIQDELQSVSSPSTGLGTATAPPQRVLPSRPFPPSSTSSLRQRLIQSARSLLRYQSDGKSEEEGGSKNVQAEKEHTASASFLQIFRLNAPEWPYIVLGTIGAAVQGTTTPVFAILFGEVLGTLSIAEEGRARKEADFYSLMFLILGIAAALSSFLMIYMFSISGEILTARLRKLAFAAMLRQEMAWFDDHDNSVGALCSRLSGDAADVQGATGSRVGTIVQSLTTLGIGVVLALYYDWRLGMVCMPFVPFVIAAVYFQAKILAGQNISEAKVIDTAGQVAMEAITNIRTVASLHREELVSRQYSEELRVPHEAALRKSHIRGVTFGLAQSMPLFAFATSMFYGGYLVKEDEISYQSVFKVAEALIMGTMMVGQSVAFAPNYTKATVAAGRVFALLRRTPAIDTAAYTGRILSGEVHDVGVREVHFRYPSRPRVPVLAGLSCEAGQGRVLALVGGSGSGKSTVIALLQRFYDPQAGTVSLNNENLKELQVGSARGVLGLVSQEPILFDRTVFENITYGDNTRQVTVQEVVEAATRANIHAFVQSLPKGYETRVGAKGTQLSGGQKQRVAIARALVRNPSVLLLDEATSALDTESEKVVQEALEKAQEGRTCIVIAHRLSTVKNAHTIALVRAGRIVESGTHKELMELGGYYHALYHTNK